MSRESLIANLQRYRKEADANRNFSGGKPGNTLLPLFGKYPPEVQQVCREYLNSLCVKHKDRLEANYGRYYGVLVATATRLALDKLGLRQISRKGFHRFRTINRIKVALGLRDKNLNDIMNNRRKRATASANLQKCTVRQIPLEC
jgi:hypothetical protein